MKCGEDCHRQPWWCFTPEQLSGFLCLLPFSVFVFCFCVSLFFFFFLCCLPRFCAVDQVTRPKPTCLQLHVLILEVFSGEAVVVPPCGQLTLSWLLPTLLFCSSVFALNNQTEVSDLVMSTILNCGSDFLWTMSGSKSIYWSPEFQTPHSDSCRWFLCLKIFSFVKPNAHKIILSLSFVFA